MGKSLELAGVDRLAAGATLEGSDPYLVLLHGTFSNTEGAFKGLRNTGEWHEIVDHYHGRAAALEHKTLSVSPAVNALDLARHLPDDARLHLVSHSRGGLVGELLSLASPGLNGSPAALDPGRFGRGGGENAQVERELLEQLVIEMADRNARVERFVRVACPAGGTLLVSRRLDQYAGVLFNILSRIPNVSGWFLTVLKTLVLTFVDQRTDPTLLPGLEAQMPSSPLVHLLNSSRHRRDDELAVIAGDVEPGRWAKWLAVRAADLFFREDHDYVVDTRSMYQGAPRDRGFVSFHYGKEVGHSSYFTQDVSRRRLRSWLFHQSGEPPVEFDDLDRDLAKLAKVKRGRGVAPDAPAVIVVPTFLGSSLKSKQGDLVWPSSSALAGEGLDLLKQKTLEAGSLLKDTYQGLLDRLAEEFRVVPFAYDWRGSLGDVGQQLIADLEQELEGGTVVHVVAHGTGGLVARLLQADSSWTKARARGGRMLLLGCPDAGSYRSLQLATGKAALAHQLSLLDSGRSTAQVARLLRSFPWLLETLPEAGDWWQVAWWKKCGIGWAPSQPALEAARNVAENLGKARSGDGVIKIAGFGYVTPSEVEYKGAGLVYSGADDGDGVVRVDSTTAAADAAYYVRASHGELPSHPDYLDGYADLLCDGRSHRLASESPAVASGLSILPAVGERQLFPTSGDLAAAAVGRESAAPASAAEEPVIHLEVVHGDLGFAEYPVMVGHYDGSTIEGAERALDWHLDYRLTNRDVVGVYPGAVGSAEIVANEAGKSPPGAIIIGMGEIGDLNPSIVVRGVTEGALRQAMADFDRAESAAGGEEADDDGAPPAPLSVGIAPVLVGTSGISGLSIESSVEAIVKGVEAANDRLRERELLDQVRVDRIQIVELFEDIAIEAAYVARELRDRRGPAGMGGRARVAPASRLGHLEGGSPGHPKSQYSRGEWRPIVIESVKTVIEDRRKSEDDEESAVPRVREDLSFKSIGLLARAESTVHAGQRDLIVKLIREAVGRSRSGKQIYNTLYELMFPNYLKGQTRESDNLLLVLDGEATRYPWEMLATRTASNVEPLSIQTGMLRRLLTRSFSNRPRAAGIRALVIGDPPAEGWPRLGGARREAETVRDRLSSQFEVEAIISPEPSGGARSTEMHILNTLFQDEYRILHIAAHGEFNPKEPERSGAVIGDDAFLTSLVLRQLPAIPQLVFLNCCHLGQVDGRESRLEGKFNDFAASVSQQLIRDGVRAVVAAGWAVDDEAAAAFADTFYQRMLQGYPFGDAVKRARKGIYEDFEGTNTWGAYQCYGDPGFKLVSRRPKSKGNRRFVARSELLEYLEEVAKDAQDAQRQEERERLADDVRKMLKTVPRDWLAGKVYSHAGKALGELGEFEQAIDFYQRAVADWNAETPFEVLEQLANLSIRYALELSKGENPDEELIKKNVERARTRLDQLIDIAPTPERYAMFGSLFRRLAMLGNKDAIRQAERQYGEAYRLFKEKAGVTDPYYAINWGVFRILRGRISKKDRAEIEAIAKEGIAEARRRVRTRPEFWNRVAEPDAEVMLGLLHRDLDRRASAIEKQYKGAFAKGSSERQRKSVFDHLESLRVLLSSQSKRKLAEAITGLAQGLGS